MDENAIPPAPASPKATQGTAPALGALTPPAVAAGGALPKKYIRTFSGDIQTVQAGGKPDLTPLIEKQPAAVERLVAASPIPETNINQFSPSVPILTIKPVIETPPPPEPLGSSPIETYSSDFSAKVKETKSTTASIIAAEQDAAPITTEEDTSDTKKNVFFIIGSVLLIALGLGAAGYAYVKYAPAPVPIIVQEVAAPIFVDERQEISGNGVLLLQAIEQSVTNNLAPRTVRFIYTASSTIQGFDIFSQLPLSAPDIVKRNVNAESSMAGVVNVGASQTPFFILSVAAYRDTFAGMLSWESMMTGNLSILFPAYPAPIVPIVATSSPLATTTIPAKKKTKTATTTVIVTTTQKTASTTPAFIPGFRDEVVNNHDVRVYRDAQGRGVIIYGYWNQTTLVIARDPLAFTEIISRLATAHTP